MLLFYHIRKKSIPNDSHNQTVKIALFDASSVRNSLCLHTFDRNQKSLGESEKTGTKPSHLFKVYTSRYASLSSSERDYRRKRSAIIPCHLSEANSVGFGMGKSTFPRHPTRAHYK